MVELDILISTVLGHHEVCSPGHNSKYEVCVLVLCWLLLDGEGVDAAGGHHQHGDEHAELRGVGAPHRGQD